MRGGMRATRTSLPVLPCFHTTWPQRRACPRTTSTITAAGPASTPPVSQRGRPLVLGQHPAPPPPPPSTPLPALGLFGLKWRPTTGKAPLSSSLSFRSSKLGWFGLARSLSLLSSPEDAGLQEGEREGRQAPAPPRRRRFGYFPPSSSSAPTLSHSSASARRWRSATYGRAGAVLSVAADHSLSRAEFASPIHLHSFRGRGVGGAD
jgi:hypothetical protein